MAFLRIALDKTRRWSARSSWALILGTGAIVVDAVSLPSSPRALLAMGLLAIAYGVYDITSRVYITVKEIGELYEQPRKRPLLAQYEAPYDSWIEIQHHSGLGIYNQTLNRRLQETDQVLVKATPGQWRPLGEHERIRKLRHLDIEFDEIKIRINDELTSTTESLSIQRVLYSSFLVTNKLAVVQQMRQSETPALDATAVLYRNGLIPRLSRSHCANHIGVDCLLILTEGRIILSRQKFNNQLSPGMLASSASGSADWKDIDRNRSLNQTLMNAMRRELIEEVGLSRSSTARTIDIQVLGYSRFTHLGGKPQFFGVARMDHVRTRVTSKEQRWIADHVAIDFDPVAGIDGLLESIHSFETTRKHEISFPLHVNIKFFRDWLQENSRHAEWLGLSSPDATN